MVTLTLPDHTRSRAPFTLVLDPGVAVHAVLERRNLQHHLDREHQIPRTLPLVYRSQMNY